MLVPKTQNLMFIDLETTGLFPWLHAPWQIAAILVDGATFESLATFESRVRVWKDTPIDPKAQEMSGLTETELREGLPEQPVVHKKFTDFLKLRVDPFNKRDKYIFGGYNANFDQQFLRKWFRNLGDNYFGSYFFSPPLDVMSLAIADLYPRRSEMINFRLETVAKAYGLEANPEDYHEAMFDVEITVKIFRAIMEGGDNEVSTNSALLQNVTEHAVDEGSTKETDNDE